MPFLSVERRNWGLHAIEGGLFMGSLALVDAQTLVPAMVHALGGPGWMVGLMPVMMQVGFALPTLLTAHYVSSLGRFHPILLWTGVPMRLPYLITGLVLLGWGDRAGLCLAALVLTPLLAGLVSGVNATAWPQLVARTVPPERRSSLFAVRFAISAGLGIVAGWLVHRTLDAHPGTAGYGQLYLWAFAGLMLSYALFACIREPAAEQAKDPETGLLANLRGLPTLIREDARLRAYLGATTLQTLTGIAVPYLGIQAVAAVGSGNAFLGTLISWQMGGSVLGGLIAGWAGDRWGGRRVMIVARALCGLVFLAAPWLTAAWTWIAVFALFGAGNIASAVGTAAFQLELLPERGRSNRLAIMTFTLLPVALLAGAAGGWAWEGLGPHAFLGLSLGAGVMSFLSLSVLFRLDAEIGKPTASP